MQSCSQEEQQTRCEMRQLKGEETVAAGEERQPTGLEQQHQQRDEQSAGLMWQRAATRQEGRRETMEQARGAWQRAPAVLVVVAMEPAASGVHSLPEEEKETCGIHLPPSPPDAAMCSPSAQRK